MGLRRIARRLTGAPEPVGAGRPYACHSPNAGPLPDGGRPGPDADEEPAGLVDYDEGPADPEPDDGDRPGDGEQ
jgi:hypothetical protein